MDFWSDPGVVFEKTLEECLPGASLSISQTFIFMDQSQRKYIQQLFRGSHTYFNQDTILPPAFLLKVWLGGLQIVC